MYLSDQPALREEVRDIPRYLGWLDEAEKSAVRRQWNSFVRKEDESEGDEWLNEELVAAAAMGSAVAIAGKKFLDYLDRSYAVSLARLMQGLDEGNNAFMRDAFTDTTERRVATAVSSAMNEGANTAFLGGASILSGLPMRQTVLDGMVNSAKYYTNNYFNSRVMPTLVNAIEGFQSEGTSPEDTYLGIRSILDERLKSVPYWRTVANSATSRAYQYGVVKTGEQTGARAFRIVTVDDERRSDICTALDGKELPIGPMVQHIERIAGATEDEIKEVAPWLTSAEGLSEMSSSELADEGVGPPPYHGNCRSYLELVR